MPQIYDLITEDAERTAADAEGRTWYSVDPDTLYPWTIDRIAEALEGGPATPASSAYLERARALPVEAWQLAATDRDAWPSVVETTPEQRAELAQRVEALALIRAWALELHHAAIGYAPRAVYIARRPAWRE